MHACVSWHLACQFLGLSLPSSVFSWTQGRGLPPGCPPGTVSCPFLSPRLHPVVAILGWLPTKAPLRHSPDFDVCCPTEEGSDPGPRAERPHLSPDSHCSGLRLVDTPPQGRIPAPILQPLLPKRPNLSRELESSGRGRAGETPLATAP